jgi:hypothetical protein
MYVRPDQVRRSQAKEFEIKIAAKLSSAGSDKPVPLWHRRYDLSM